MIMLKQRSPYYHVTKILSDVLFILFPGWFYIITVILVKASIIIFTVLSMLFPLLQLYCTSEEPRNGV